MGAVAPRLKILMTSGSKKEAQKYCFFSLKSPRKRTPSRFPSGAPMERDTHLQGICMSLKDLIRIPLKKAPIKKRPSMFPRSGVHMEMDAHFQALLNEFPSKGALLHPSFKVPSIRVSPQSQVPRREMPISGDYLDISSRVPQEEASPKTPFNVSYMHTFLSQY